MTGERACEQHEGRRPRGRGSRRVRRPGGPPLRRREGAGLHVGAVVAEGTSAGRYSILHASSSADRSRRRPPRLATVLPSPPTPRPGFSLDVSDGSGEGRTLILQSAILFPEWRRARGVLASGGGGATSCFRGRNGRKVPPRVFPVSVNRPRRFARARSRVSNVRLC